MAKARQQYQADWTYVDKQEKEFTLTQEIIEKLDSIEPGAERNFIQGIKVNWETQVPDQHRVVSLTIPEVIDELNSIDNQASLSARQGRVLYNYIKNLQSLWKFLSNWNATTGLPTTNPSWIPYEYHTWDYFVVSVVGNTNYRPVGNSYQWVASTTVETDILGISDIYFYDGVDWLLMHNSARAIAVDTSLSTTSTNPVENRVVTNAINLKANDADISTVGKTNNYNDLDNLPIVPDSLDDLSWTSDDITEWNSHLFLTSVERQKLVNTTWTNTWDETTASIKTKLWQASASSDGWISSLDWNKFNQADTALQPWDNISELVNDEDYMAYGDFEFNTLAGSSVTLDLSSDFSPSSDFTVNAPSEIKDWQEYILRVSNLSTIYTMTLGNNIINPFQADLTLTPNATDMFVFLWVWGSLELQPDIPSLLDTSMSNTSKNGVQNRVIKDYVDEQISEATAGAVSDITYASSWNWVTGIAPSKNAVYDKISTMDTAISGKQNTISDLATIRSNATAWAWAATTIAWYGDIVTHNVNEFATASQGSKADTALQSWDNISELNNDSGFITSASLPTVNNTTITLSQGWVTVDTFTTNASTTKTIDFDWNIFVTQAEYNTLSPWNDWNTYFIYE